jgi:hypothetical protein
LSQRFYIEKTVNAKPRIKNVGIIAKPAEVGQVTDQLSELWNGRIRSWTHLIVQRSKKEGAGDEYKLGSRIE